VRGCLPASSTRTTAGANKIRRSSSLTVVGCRPSRRLPAAGPLPLVEQALPVEGVRQGREDGRLGAARSRQHPFEPAASLDAHRDQRPSKMASRLSRAFSYRLYGHSRVGRESLPNRAEAAFPDATSRPSGFVGRVATKATVCDWERIADLISRFWIPQEAESPTDHRTQTLGKTLPTLGLKPAP